MIHFTYCTSKTPVYYILCCYCLLSSPSCYSNQLFSMFIFYFDRVVKPFFIISYLPIRPWSMIANCNTFSSFTLPLSSLIEYIFIYIMSHFTSIISLHKTWITKHHLFNTLERSISSTLYVQTHNIIIRNIYHNTLNIGPRAKI